MFFVTDYLKQDNYVEQDNFSKYRIDPTIVVCMRTAEEIQRSKHKECRNDAFFKNDGKQAGQHQQ
ncbi:hypothetical protein GCM10027284_19640 [Cyclobacterium sediminis]